MELQGDAVISAVGILPFLEPGPLYVTTHQWRVVDTYTSRLRSSVRRFLLRPGFTAEVELPELDIPRVFKALNRFAGQTPEGIYELMAGKLAGLEQRLHTRGAVAQVVARAEQFLQLVMPRRTQQRLGRNAIIEPSALEVSRFHRSYGVVNDPFVVLEDLNEGTLDRRSVHTLRQVFPATFDAIQTALFELNADVLSRDESHDIPFVKERVLGILLGTPPVSGALQRTIQEAFEASAQQAENQRRGGGGASKGDPLQTQIQRSAAT